LRAARLDANGDAIDVAGKRIARDAAAAVDVWLKRGLEKTDG
jgi:hypothetical protein